MESRLTSKQAGAPLAPPKNPAREDLAGAQMMVFENATGHRSASGEIFWVEPLTIDAVAPVKESNKLNTARQRFEKLVFSLAYDLLDDESLAEEVVCTVFDTLLSSSEVFEDFDVESPEFEREIHRVTYETALVRMVLKHKRPIPQ